MVIPKRNKSLRPQPATLQHGTRVRVVAVNQYSSTGVQCVACRVVFVGRAVELIFPYHYCKQSS